MVFGAWQAHSGIWCEYDTLHICFRGCMGEAEYIAWFWGIWTLRGIVLNLPGLPIQGQLKQSQWGRAQEVESSASITFDSFYSLMVLLWPMKTQCPIYKVVSVLTSSPLSGAPWASVVTLSFFWAQVKDSCHYWSVRSLRWSWLIIFLSN